MLIFGASWLGRVGRTGDWVREGGFGVSRWRDLFCRIGVFGIEAFGGIGVVCLF